MKEKNTHNPFAKLGAPAQRALANAGISTVAQLAAITQKEFLKMHGVGKASLPVVKQLMEEQGLSFKV